MFKVWLRRLHLFLACASGLFLINLSLSGALLLYAKDIQTFVNPQFWLVKNHQNINNNTHNPPLKLSQLIERIETKGHNQKVVFIEVADVASKAWQVRLTNQKYFSVDPYNGDILLSYQFDETFYGFVMSWHRWLLYSNEKGERPLQMWVSIAALIFMIELMIGFYLWAKPKARIKRLKIVWRANSKILLYQLHTMLGVIFVVPLFLIAFSGIAFYWQDATKSVVETITAGNIESHHFKVPLSSEEETMQQTQYQLDYAYSSAKNALKNGNVYRIYPPQKNANVLALRIKMPEESHANSWSWANPYSGKLLSSFNAVDTSFATQVWNFKYKFHIGEFIGWPIKILWLLLSLLPSFFVCSGLYLYWKRRKKR